MRIRPDIQTKSFHGMISSSSKMFAFFELLKRVSRTESPILIRGESGTGKELAAKAIHELSVRSKQAFHAVNCATLTPELANSELFGHEKGSFTGAVSDHKGYFEESHRGTLFLDEIAELPLAAQSRLLRVLQEKAISRVGSTRSRKVDVRILSATHRALRSEVAEGHFREDLMYRLRVVPIFLPNLIDRGQDLDVLTWRFIDEFNAKGWRQIEAIDNDAYDALFAYHWPGNIRELRNNIEFAFAVGEGSILKLEDLTPELRGEAPFGEAAPNEFVQPYELEEKRRILEALNQAHGNKGAAAQALNMSRSTLWRKMKILGLA